MKKHKTFHPLEQQTTRQEPLFIPKKWKQTYTLDIQVQFKRSIELIYPWEFKKRKKHIFVKADEQTEQKAKQFFDQRTAKTKLQRHTLSLRSQAKCEKLPWTAGLRYSMNMFC